MSGREREPQEQVKAEAVMTAPAPLTVAKGSFAVVLGLIIALGHRDAWSGVDFHNALQVPGAPESWGWALTALGLCVIVGKVAFRRNRLLLLIGLAGCGVWCMFFALAFLSEFVDTHEVGLAETVTYLFLSALYLWQFTLYRNLYLRLM